MSILFRLKEKVEIGIRMTSRNCFYNLQIAISGIIQEALWITVSKMVSWCVTKERKLMNIIGNLEND